LFRATRKALLYIRTLNFLKKTNSKPTTTLAFAIFLSLTRVLSFYLVPTTAPHEYLTLLRAKKNFASVIIDLMSRVVIGTLLRVWFLQAAKIHM
jgi:hypothetical protein